MKAIEYNGSEKLKLIEIVPLADLHLGDKMCDIELIKSKIEYIKSTDNAFCILNGDIMNNSTKTSIGDIYNEELKPMDQLKLACELLEPIKHKILAITSGNHEFRTWKSDGIDLTHLMAKQLKLENRYAENSAVLFLRFGKQSSHHDYRKVQYTIYITHGSGGGRKEGAKAIRLADMASIIDADIYIHSHTHLPMVMKQSFHRVDTRSSTINIVPKLFVNTSSFLNYGGYGEAQEFKPSSKDTPHIFLSGTKKEFTAKL